MQQLDSRSPLATNDILSFAHQLHQGLHAGDDVDYLRAYAVRSWNEHVQARYEREEELLMPELKRLGAARRARALQRDHRQIAHLVRQLHSPHPAAAACLSVLSELVRKHEWYKQQELLPLLEERLDAPARDRLRTQVVEHSTEPALPA